MARILSYNFPSVNKSLSAVCAVQNTAGAADLILNGNFVDPVTGGMSFKNKGYSRSVSFSSVANNSAVHFSIVGTENGVVVEENAIAGPNNSPVNGPVFSAKTYDTITSISVDMAVNGIEIGGGLLGCFGPLGGNAGVPGFPVWAVSVTPIDTMFLGTIKYSIHGTLNNIINTYRYQDLIDNFILLDMDGNTGVIAPNHSISFGPSTQLLITTEIDDDDNGLNDEFTFTYYVPGI